VGRAEHVVHRSEHILGTSLHPDHRRAARPAAAPKPAPSQVPVSAPVPAPDRAALDRADPDPATP
jgi:hypothetical protein